MAMTHREALEVLADRRGQHVVLTTHGSVDLWVSLSDTPLDFSYVPASMGQGPALGLGLALAQSRHGVVVVCGDGHLLMNLGCLVTLAAHPADGLLIVIDNGVYEVIHDMSTADTNRLPCGKTSPSASAPASSGSVMKTIQPLPAPNSCRTPLSPGPGGRRARTGPARRPR